MRIPKVLLFLLWWAVGTLPLVAQVTPCTIFPLEVGVGDCTSDSTFLLELDFKVQNPPSNEFEVFGNGVNLGTYNLNQLPLAIKNFPAGAGIGSFVRVCFKGGSPNVPPCCNVKQFFGPNCAQGGPCEIYDINAVAGDCQPAGRYSVKLDFKVKNPAGLSFEVWTGNNISLGTFPLSNLPVVLSLPVGTSPTETLRICLKDKPDCCATVTVAVPPCPPPPCVIRNLRVETGACTSDSTYKITLNFVTPAAIPLDSFDVYAAGGQYLGRYSTASLPLTLEFPWNGKNIDVVTVCLKSSNCCRRLEFNAPNCIAKPCGIEDIKVDVGECLSPQKYRIKVSVTFSPLIAIPFKVGIWSGNGDFLGAYSMGDFPLGLVFPASGEDIDRIKVCLLTPTGTEFCCKIAEFKAPNCDVPPCPITDLKVEVAGPCNPDGTYPIVINFKYTASTPGAFGVWSGDGKFLGIFSLNALPVKIAKFPASGKPVDRVRVCLIQPNAPGVTPCCLEAEFKAPDCQNTPCGISNIKVEVGPCNPDGTYRLVLNFVAAASQGQFALWAANGQFLGVYPFSALPLTIANFPGSGKDVDAIRICVLGPAGTIANTCCITHEFKAPNCQLGCAIKDLEVKVGDCNPDGTFKLLLNFNVQNGGSAIKFTLWVNGTVFGTYGLNKLPLTIPNFPGGNGGKAEIRVCLISLTTTTDPADTCCAALTFITPNCQGQGCKIADLTVKVGDCNPDGTYKVQINFKAVSPAPVFFSVWANGQFIGTYPLSALPLTIPNFPASGKPKDAVKVCLVSSPNTPQQGLCCEGLEFSAPDCSGNDDCIEDLTVKVGDCNPDGTYRLQLNFKVKSLLTVLYKFELWANGKLLGTYSTGDLPLTIPNFPASGKPRDVVKVCVLKLGSTEPWCCEELEFIAPNCSGLGCKIVDLKAVPGPCKNDSTYELKLNFSVGGLLPLPPFFGVWANGVLVGTYPLSALPLTIPNFPGSGNKQDKLRVCIVTTNAAQLCCVETVIDAPDCKKACKIWDVQVQATPCLCEQFFAVLTFHHQNGGAAGFDVVGANGDVYGSYPYSQQQPLILGPFDGDGKTPYVFIVRDKQDPNCNDGIKLGFIDCPDLAPPAPPTAAVSLSLSPNPAAQWVTVMARSQNGTVLGQAVVEVRKPDGRLMRSEVVPNGNLFTLNVAELPAGLYRVSVQTAEGRYESSFVKQ